MWTRNITHGAEWKCWCQILACYIDEGVTGCSWVPVEVLGPGELLLRRMNATFAQFNLFITTCKWSCGKVMLLHMSVILFTGCVCAMHVPCHTCALSCTPPAMHAPCHACPHHAPLPCMVPTMHAPTLNTSLPHTHPAMHAPAMHAPCHAHPLLKCGWHASYWNAVLVVSIINISSEHSWESPKLNTIQIQKPPLLYNKQIVTFTVCVIRTYISVMAGIGGINQSHFTYGCWKLLK